MRRDEEEGDRRRERHPDEESIEEPVIRCGGIPRGRGAFWDGYGLNHRVSPRATVMEGFLDGHISSLDTVAVQDVTENSTLIDQAGCARLIFCD